MQHQVCCKRSQELNVMTKSWQYFKSLLLIIVITFQNNHPAMIRVQFVRLICLFLSQLMPGTQPSIHSWLIVVFQTAIGAGMETMKCDLCEALNRGGYEIKTDKKWAKLFFSPPLQPPCPEDAWNWAELVHLFFYQLLSICSTYKHIHCAEIFQLNASPMGFDVTNVTFLYCGLL